MSFHNPSPYRHPPSLSPPPSTVRIIHRSVSPIPSHPSNSSIFLPPPPSSLPSSSLHSPSFLSPSLPPPSVFHPPPASLPPPAPREGRWGRENNDLMKENSTLKKKLELLEEIIRHSGLEEIESKVEKLMKENRKLTSLIQNNGKEGFFEKDQ